MKKNPLVTIEMENGGVIEIGIRISRPTPSPILWNWCKRAFTMD